VLNCTLTAATLHSDEVVPDNKKAIFYAAAELAVRHFSLKPETYTKLTYHELGGAGPARLAPCIVKVSSQTRYYHSIR
jgi:hypothetical protein